VVFASVPVDCDPLLGITPVQPPEASQVIARWEFHVRVELASLPTVEGAAVRLTVGGGTATMRTSVDCVVDPP